MTGRLQRSSARRRGRSSGAKSSDAPRPKTAITTASHIASAKTDQTFDPVQPWDVAPEPALAAIPASTSTVARTQATASPNSVELVEVIGFRSRRKVQPMDQADAIERTQMREQKRDARRQLHDGDIRIARLLAKTGAVE